MKAIQKEKRMKKPKTRTTRRLRKQKFCSGLFLAPSLLGVLLFFILPFLVVIFYSLVDNPISKNFVLLENYAKVLQNAAFKTAVKNTAMFSAIAVPSC